MSKMLMKFRETFTKTIDYYRFFENILRHELNEIDDFDDFETF